MPLEKFIPKKPAHKREPRALIRPSGLISLPLEALQEAGIDPGTAAVLYFDRRRKLIAIEFVDGGDAEGAIRLSRRRGTVGVKEPQFFAEFRLKIEAPCRCPVSFDPTRRMALVDVREIPRQRGRRSAQ